ncbi:hypothetical protein SELMODRAFT_418717 [Selaginella moellendorffii]|uniref:Uncharacterized protein n=1 Tax=Selaginella moellendorffii TaxID=88036 RepID=D8S6X8_SELML|nr:hypothetical protein SELMODRAFT_418717 [Selaginella moellendorffii]
MKRKRAEDDSEGEGEEDREGEAEDGEREPEDGKGEAEDDSEGEAEHGEGEAEDDESEAEVEEIGFRSGSSWSKRELKFFKFKVTEVNSFQDFFGEPPCTVFGNSWQEFLDLDMTSAHLVSSTKEISFRSRAIELLVKDIISATKTHKGHESCVDDLVKKLLEYFHYDRNGGSVRSRITIPLRMSHHKTEANPDHTVEDEATTVKMLVVEDKSSEVANDREHKGHHPEAQLLAELVAAVQENERLHKVHDLGDMSEQMVFPGIVFMGTLPTFYLVTMTKALAHCVRRGQRPTFVTESSLGELAVEGCGGGVVELHELKLHQLLQVTKP